MRSKLSRSQNFVAAIVVVCCWSCCDDALAQVQSSAPVAEVRHLGNGPVNINTLSQDILNCDVCRQRLGLPPLNLARLPDSSSPTEPAGAKRMLGSPGLISSATAAQMAAGGLVVEEFRPPQPQPGDIQLDGIPFEVRQQFMRNLDLPFGSKVLSANVLDPNKPSIALQPSEKTLVEDLTLPPPHDRHPTPEVSLTLETQELKEQLDGMKRANEQLQSKIKELVDSQAQKQLKLEQAAAERAKSIAEERQNLERQVALLDEKQRQMQIEAQDRIARSESANKEALMMLEKRTAELTELQSKLRTQQKELATAKAQSAAKAKEEKSEQPDSRKRKSKKKESGKDND